jgi:hypothetical protein
MIEVTDCRGNGGRLNTSVLFLKVQVHDTAAVEPIIG